LPAADRWVTTESRVAQRGPYQKPAPEPHTPARLCRSADLPAGVSPHSLRHSYATESLRLGPVR